MTKDPDGNRHSKTCNDAGPCRWCDAAALRGAKAFGLKVAKLYSRTVKLK